MRFRRHQEAAAAATTRLLLLFVAVVLATVAAVNALLYLAWLATVPMAARLPALFFETNTALVLLFVLGGSWVESLALREGGAHVARLAGARPAQPVGHSDAQRLERRFVDVVQEMALAAGTRPPAAWVLARDDAINAFAAGWAADDAVIAVTRGALERLTRAELQGVVAHELSHLVHEDTRLNMRLIGLVWGLQMVHGFGRTLAASDEQGRRGPGVLFGLALILVGWVGWLAGRVLQASVSRQREFLADASAVKYTRLVDGIGGALRKIAGENPPGGRRGTRRACRTCGWPRRRRPLWPPGGSGSPPIRRWPSGCAGCTAGRCRR
jgi:Zn-dependent protease with chaperone function